MHHLLAAVEESLAVLSDVQLLLHHCAEVLNARQLGYGEDGCLRAVHGPNFDVHLRGSVSVAVVLRVQHAVVPLPVSCCPP